MATLPVSRRLLEGILSIGASPDESDSRRSGRRVFMLAFIIATLLGIPLVIARFSQSRMMIPSTALRTPFPP